jgi:hypothetical protein
MVTGTDKLHYAKIRLVKRWVETATLVLIIKIKTCLCDEPRTFHDYI